MNNEKPIRDQAERLRKRVEPKAERIMENKNSLPPRSEIHRKKQKKTNFKMKYPVIRLMALFFILLPITFFSIISYLEGGIGIGNQAGEWAGVEVIDVKGKNSNEVIDSDADENGALETDEEPLELIVPSAAEDENSGGEKDSPLNESKNGQQQPEVVKSVKEKEKTGSSAVQQPDSEKESVVAEPQADGMKNLIYHTVQPKETLFRVAMKYYKSQEGIPIIRKANNLSGNEIQAGQVLKIPLSE